VAELLTLEKAAAAASAASSIVKEGTDTAINGSGAKTAFRTDPKMDPYGSWEAVEAAKKEYLTKEAYEIDVNGVTIKLHHNPKGATEHSNCMVQHLTEDIYNRLKDKATVNGISLDKCIQTGLVFAQNPTFLACVTPRSFVGRRLSMLAICFFFECSVCYLASGTIGLARFAVVVSTGRNILHVFHCMYCTLDEPRFMMSV
jgi:hypothetical protein